MFYEDSECQVRIPKSPLEEQELELCMIENQHDAMRPRLLGVPKEIFALDYEFTRDFDRINRNRFGIYLKQEGVVLIGVIRLANGDRSELGPEPEAMAQHKGMQRMKAMSKVLEERAKNANP